MRRLVLFDIDGTLLLTHGAGRRALEQSLESILHQPFSLEGMDFAGKTDWSIINDLLKQHNIYLAPDDPLFHRILQTFSEVLAQEIQANGVEVLPGITSLLEALHNHPAVILGLLTGNLKPNAVLKLKAAGLNRYFVTGAFGDDHPDRNALPAIALKRTRLFTGLPLSGKHTCIIGDTPRDISCARVIDAYTIAVCTGPYTCQELKKHQPHQLFRNLSDTSQVLDTLLNHAVL